MVGERTTWTSTQLIERGWTRAGINKFLQPCSYTYSFRYHKDVALYKAKTALRIEETPEFKEFFQKSPSKKRKNVCKLPKLLNSFTPSFL